MKISIKPPRQLLSSDESLLALVRKTTLVIGIKIDIADRTKIANLSYLLSWLDYFYSNTFDVLIVEQGEKQRIPAELLARYRPRYIMLYNPGLYNRGWGYNAAIKNHCHNAEVVVTLDIDVLPTYSFLDSVIKCHQKYKFVSPYRNIYYTSADEAAKIVQNNDLTTLVNPESLSNPVTLTSGIAIFQKHLYLSIYGYEQYIGYGGEDRALDVTLLAYCEPNEIFVQDDIFPHLNHPVNLAERSKTNEIMQHLSTNYGCEYSPLVRKREYIHRYCKHKTILQILNSVSNKIGSFGNENLYHYHNLITINGQHAQLSTQKSIREILLETNSLISRHRTADAYIAAIHGLKNCNDVEGLKILKNKISYLEYFLDSKNHDRNSSDLLTLFSGKAPSDFSATHRISTKHTHLVQSYHRRRYLNHLELSKNNDIKHLEILCVVANHNCNNNAQRLFETISKYFDVLLIDSGSIPPPLCSLKLNNVYYGGLLNEAYAAASTLKYKYLLFICSDVVISIDNIEKLKSSIHNIDLSTIGVYAPSTEGRAHPFCHNHQATGLRVVPFVEGFIFLVDIMVLREFLPTKIKFGWGLDFMKGFYCRKHRKLCVIDDTISVFHPPETGYSSKMAKKEMEEFFDSQDMCADLSNFTCYGIENYIRLWKEGRTISVIITCYNHGRYLGESIMSVLLQYYNHVEIIIVDDGSTDCTEEIATSFTGRFCQVKYIKKSNSGLSSSRNAGLAIAQGQYLQFLDADDYLSLNKFISQLLLVEKTGANISVSNYKCFKEDEPSVHYKYSRENFVGDPLEDLVCNWKNELSIPIHCFLFKTNAIDKMYFDESLPSHEDWDFHLRVAAKNPKYVHDPYSYAFYRVRSSSISRDRDLLTHGFILCMSKALKSTFLCEKAALMMARRLIEAQRSVIDDKENQIASLSQIIGDNF